MEGAVYHTLYHVLTNPVYAGSYAYGRRRIASRPLSVVICAH